MGKLFELSEDGKSISKVLEDRSVIIIPDGVTSFYSHQFYPCKSLQTLVIPKSVEKIHSVLFDSEKLEAFVVDEDNAYYKSINGILYNKDCTKLIRFPIGKQTESFELPEMVEVIGEYAFDDCQYLKQFEAYPSSLRIIGASAFCGCSSLLDVQLPNEMEYIGDWAFGNCFTLKHVNIPKGLKTINDHSFSGTKIESAIIPYGVKEICGNAFSGCKNLVSVTIPNSVESIGVGAFGGCAFSHLSIPNSVKEIYHWAFHRSALEDIEIPSSVTRIGNNAFDKCLSLKSCRLPDSINYIAEGTFEGCSALTNIDLPSSIVAIGKSAFKGCSGLKEIDLSNNISTIEYNAFASCSSLRRINLPRKLVKLGHWAFLHCSSLEFINSNHQNNHFTSIDGVLYNKQETILIKYPEAKNNKVFKIPHGVLSIGTYAFSNCLFLERVEFSETVRDVGNGAFLGSNKLSKLYMSENLKKIETHAFTDTSIEEITIPSSVCEIEDFVFVKSDLKLLKAIHSKITNVNDVVYSDACFYEADFDNVVLYVPPGTRWDYKNHPDWGKYKHIEIDNC